MTRSPINRRYTRTAIALHWMIALAIIGLLAVGKYMTNLEWSTDAERRIWLTQNHKSLGITVLVLSLVRLMWRLGHKAPPLPMHTPRWEKLAAHGTHMAFYAVMIGMPIIGWLMVSTTTSPTKIFGLFQLPLIPGLNDGENPAALGERLRDIHMWVANGTIALIVLHVSAALRHQFVLKDGILGRMIPWVKGHANDS